MKNIAVIDLSTTGLFLYSVPKNYDSEEIEEFINEQGHHLSNCSWGEFDGEITDLREEKPEKPRKPNDDKNPECYVEFLNADNNFKKEKVDFLTLDEAKTWFENNMENWSLDMIKYY